MIEENKRILEATRKIGRLSRKIRESDIGNLGLAIGIEREVTKIIVMLSKIENPTVKEE